MQILSGPPAKITDSIYHLKFNSQQYMAKTLLRFQEFYENPKFRGTIFNLQEFQEFYTKRNGAFTYYDDWDGFNFPSSALAPFRSNKFPMITMEEWFVMALTSKMKDPFYIIATPRDSSPSTLRHEIAHGLYSTNNDYRTEVQAIMEGIQLAPIIRYLWPNYHHSVFMDECHAYLLADFEYLKEEVGLKIDYLKWVSDALNGTFNYYLSDLSEFS